MEIIKQGVNRPIPVLHQIVIVYAGVNGFLDDISPDKICEFERQLFADLDASYAEFMRFLEKEQSLSEKVKDELNELLRDFKRKFK